MSETTWDSRSSARRLRTLLIAALTTVLVVVGMTIVTSTEAQATGGARHASGYNTRAGWIGSYKVRGVKAYRTGAAKAVAGRYRPSHRGTFSPARARAAWILSKYGARGTRLQAAAVDVAVLHLLAKKPYRLAGAKGRARIRQLGSNRAYVTSYARQMLEGSRGQTGPYKTTLATGGPVPAGSATRLTFTLRSSAGQGVFGIGVAFTYGSGARKIAYTNKAGVASVVVDAAPGQVVARASAMRLPDWRLSISKPKRRTAAVVALAGRTRTVTASVTVTGSTAQTVTIRNAAATVLAGNPLAGSYAIEGGSGERDVLVAVYGPGSGTNVACEGTPNKTYASTVTGSSVVSQLPTFTTSASGYYRWAVTVSANDSTPPASTCGAPVRLQRRATIGQERPEGIGQTVRVGHDYGIEVRVSGFDRTETHQVWSRAYGPFNTADGARCVDAKQLRRVTRTIPGNGTFAMPRIVATNKDVGKYFVWSSTLSSGNLILGNSSNCGVAVKVIP